MGDVKRFFFVRGFNLEEIGVFWEKFCEVFNSGISVFVICMLWEFEVEKK